ncbi:hypothetical protein [Dokdonella sp.]|uniref:hypothetical protein n=1 Tax=Dokdonella sp. TaxID=2291710 RepID=UPI003C498F63
MGEPDARNACHARDASIVFSWPHALKRVQCVYFLAMALSDGGLPGNAIKAP